MSAYRGAKRTCRDRAQMSAPGGKADNVLAARISAFEPKATSPARRDPLAHAMPSSPHCSQSCHAVTHRCARAVVAALNQRERFVGWNAYVTQPTDRGTYYSLGPWAFCSVAIGVFLPRLAQPSGWALFYNGPFVTRASGSAAKTR